MEGATAQRVVARVRGRGFGVVAACTVAVALLAWPVRTIVPGVGGDWNWVVTLAYAVEHGLRFGDEIFFTYGPLGFLETANGPMLYYADVLLMAWLYAALIQLLLAATLLAGLRRRVPLAVAAAIAIVVLALVPDHTVALGFAWCLLSLRTGDDALGGRFMRAFPFALGLLVGVALLGKLNHGVALLLISAVTFAAAPRRRDALAFAGTLIATVLIAWTASGQAVGDLWPFTRNAIETFSGYAAAMGTSDSAYRWTYVAAAVLTALVLALAWDAGRGEGMRLRWGLVVLCAVYLGAAFKEGFVRQDIAHLRVFFGDLLVPLVLLPLRPSRWSLRVVGLVSCVVALIVLLGASEVGRFVNPYANVKAAGDQLSTIASSSRRETIGVDLRKQMAKAYRVGPEMRDAIGERTVMMWPYLYGEIAYGYGLHLRPLPTLEPYATYTPALDRLGAEMLASERAPARILRAMQPVAPAADGRQGTFEAPLTTLEILCRYRQVAVEEAWHVLGRSADRCETPRALGTLTAAWGKPVSVPSPRRPEALVVVGVGGTGPQGLERLTSLIVRPQIRWILLDGAPYRLIAATAVSGLLLHAPADVDYPGPFAMAPNPRSIAVGRGGGQPGGELRYTFVEVPVRPFPGAAATTADATP